MASEPMRRRPCLAVAGGGTKGRMLGPPDPAFERLRPAAIRRRKTIGAAAAEILDRAFLA